MRVQTYTSVLVPVGEALTLTRFDYTLLLFPFSTFLGPEISYNKLDDLINRDVDEMES